MSSGRRPSMSSRAMSTPKLQANPTSANHNLRMTKPGTINMLTPPASPQFSRSSHDLTRPHIATDEGSIQSQNISLLQYPAAVCNNEERNSDGTLVCPYRIEIITDHRGRNQALGYGAWSTVFRATCHAKASQSSGLTTPPLSLTPRPPLLVAVKQAARGDAKSILKNEARILTSLMQTDRHENFVIKFYGIDLEDESLVLQAYPLSLEQHVQACARAAQRNLTTRNMFDPVVGNISVWMDLANQLISGLVWLHEVAGVVHGDVKPANILLSSTATDDAPFTFQPLYADFSSSQSLDTEDITPNTLSAVTTEYTAPELLSSAVLRDPRSTATCASDVFSLAITLLVVATGNTLVYPGAAIQRRAMATQGWSVLDFTRSGDSAARVGRQGMVSRVLERALLKVDMGRVTSSQWKDLINNMMLESPMKT